MASKCGPTMWCCNPRADQDHWRATGYFEQRHTLAGAQPFPAPPVTTESAHAAYEHVLLEAGAW